MIILYPLLRTSLHLFESAPGNDMRDVTFGITTFERPVLLSNLVRSILRYYPLARIVVADNGRQRANLPDSVIRLNLPFDCGLSRARNALVDTLRTKYLLILEDDFLFTEETRIEPLVDVLNCDSEIGAVGGALRTMHGRVAAYALDIEVFRDTMYVREATHRLRFTPLGTQYRLCDMIWNFALFRREMLRDHRWNDRLKVGEHCPYFHQVKLAAKWRVGACTESRIFHVPERRQKGYLKYRRRAEGMFRSYLAEHGIKKYQRVLPYHFEDDLHDKPNIIVLGVGHSGTSVLTSMLHAGGWSAADADEAFCESRSIRRLNQGIEKTGTLPHRQAKAALSALPQPWAIKDPRFVSTLHLWTPLLMSMERKPVLLRVRRDRDSLLHSYLRRRARGDVPQRIDQLLALCQRQYERWPWIRLSIEYELLAAAVSCFSRQRYDAGARRPGGTLHLPGKDVGPSGDAAYAADEASPMRVAEDGSAIAEFALDGSGIFFSQRAARLEGGSGIAEFALEDGSGLFFGERAARLAEDGSGIAEFALEDGSGVFFGDRAMRLVEDGPALDGEDGSGLSFGDSVM